MTLTYEEELEWAEELDIRYRSIHSYIAETMTQEVVGDPDFDLLKKDIRDILFGVNVEFDLDIPSDDFWSVEIGFRADGDLHVAILPQAIAQSQKSLEISEHPQTETTRRYTLKLGGISSCSDSYFQALVTLAKLLDPVVESSEVEPKPTGPKKFHIN